MIETGILFGNLHSFWDLDLILADATIPPASPKETYVDIPGADGSVDMTEALGGVKYSDRTGAKFTFYLNPAGGLSDAAWEEKKSQVSNLLDGLRCNITLDKDPDYYWQGRCKVSEHSSNKKLRKIVVGARLAPYKLKQNVTRVFSPICGKNLIRFPYDSGFSYTANGVTFTVNADGSVSLDGTSGGFAGFVLAAVDSTDNALSIFEDGKTYFLSGAGERKAHLTIYLSYKDESGAQKYHGSDSKPFVWKDSYTDQRLYIQVNTAGQTFENYKVYPQLEIGSVATPYEQYTPNANITLHNSRKTVCPSIIVTGEATVTFPGGEATLGKGTHKVLDLQLHEGETPVTVNGTGAIAFVYQEGDL